MGLEGAVRLDYAKELEAIDDPTARQAHYDELVAEQNAHGQATNAAMAVEIDDVIDPADTRGWISKPSGAGARRPSADSYIDPW